jgi:CheY-like chemotaxis protein
MNKLRVLVIEDHRDTSNALGKLLAEWGYEVLAAFSGTVGIEVAATWLPNAILCDIALPGLSGLEVACELRRNPLTDGITLVAMTGLGGDVERRALESGFDYFVPKPIDPEMLTQLLGKIL